MWDFANKNYPNRVAYQLGSEALGYKGTWEFRAFEFTAPYSKALLKRGSVSPSPYYYAEQGYDVFKKAFPTKFGSYDAPWEPYPPFPPQ